MHIHGYTWLYHWISKILSEMLSERSQTCKSHIIWFHYLMFKNNKGFNYKEEIRNLFVFWVYGNFFCLTWELFTGYRHLSKLNCILLICIFYCIKLFYYTQSLDFYYIYLLFVNCFTTYNLLYLITFLISQMPRYYSIM